MTRSDRSRRTGPRGLAQCVALAAAESLHQLRHEITPLRRPQTSLRQPPAAAPCPGSGRPRSASTCGSPPLIGAAVAVRRPYAAVLPAPNVEGRVADAHLATDLIDAYAQLSLLQCKRDLIVGELALPHDMLLASVRPSSCRSFLLPNGPES